MTRKELILAIDDAIRELNRNIFWSKVYYPDDLVQRSRMLIQNLSHTFYFSKDYINPNPNKYFDEFGICPAPQFSFIDVGNDPNIKALKNRHGIELFWSSEIEKNLLTDMRGEIWWTGDSGETRHELIGHFYQTNKHKISRQTFDSDDLFDYLLSLYCIKRSQSGDKDAQKVIWEIFKNECVGITKSFIIRKNILDPDNRPESLAYYIFRSVVFGTDVKNYLKEILQIETYSSVDRSIELSVRKIIKKFLNSIDFIPINLLAIVEYIKKAKVPKDFEDHYIGSWNWYCLGTLDPIIALQSSGVMIQPLYQPHKYGLFVKWLLGNWNFKRPTGAFQRRLNDYYKSKTQMVDGKRIPKRIDEVSELKENFQYHHDTTPRTKKKSLLSVNEVLVFVENLNKYAKIKQLKSEKKQAILLYRLRKNIKKGFKARKTITYQTLAEQLKCTTKTIQRLIESFENWYGQEL